jgi:alkylation response protein AidB-like acyl-CoA dehydrogenase
VRAETESSGSSPGRSWGLLYARTDPELPKHKGLSVFLLDMTLPGIEIRPIHEMTGDSHFCEVFFDHVPVRDEDLLGNAGDGWLIMLGTFAIERLGVGLEGTFSRSDAVAEAVRFTREAHCEDPVFLDRLGDLVARGETVKRLGERVAAMAERGEYGLETYVMKIAYTQLMQDSFEYIVDLMGDEGILYEDNYAYHEREFLEIEGLDPRRAFLSARARTIGGGTTEVTRNMIAERGLGMPREPRFRP